MNVLETQRLFLREFTLDDLDDLYVLYGDPQVMKLCPIAEMVVGKQDGIAW